MSVSAEILKGWKASNRIKLDIYFFSLFTQINPEPVQGYSFLPTCFAKHSWSSCPLTTHVCPFFLSCPCKNFLGILVFVSFWNRLTKLQSEAAFGLCLDPNTRKILATGQHPLWITEVHDRDAQHAVVNKKPQFTIWWLIFFFLCRSDCF